MGGAGSTRGADSRISCLSETARQRPESWPVRYLRVKLPRRQLRAALSGLARRLRAGRVSGFSRAFWTWRRGTARMRAGGALPTAGGV
jgi:hypothetical protein